MRRRTFISTGITLGALGSLMACAPDSNTPAPNSAPATGPVNTDPASLGQVELTVWDQEIHGPGLPQMIRIAEVKSCKKVISMAPSLSAMMIATGTQRSKETSSAEKNDIPLDLDIDLCLDPLGRLAHLSRIHDDGLPLGNEITHHFHPKRPWHLQQCSLQRTVQHQCPDTGHPQHHLRGCLSVGLGR